MLHIPEKATPTNRIDKVSPLLDHLLARFQSVYYPHRDLSIDETMIGFKGRVSFMQYCPLKPTKWELKAFVLADSETGYICNILPYAGQETRAHLSSCNGDLPLLAEVVVTVAEKYLGKGHHIYADRFYSSVPLADELEKKDTGYTGTIIRNRKQLPKAVRKNMVKLRSGETKAWRCRKKLVLGWRDKGKTVLMLSTVHTATLMTVTGRLGETKTKTIVIHKCNQSIGGVDKADQHSVYYSFGRHSIKWWRKLIFGLFEVAIVNLYIIYKITVTKPLTHVDCRRQIVIGLCDGLAIGEVRRQLIRPTKTDKRFLG